jgi:hypothetical protein
MAGAEEAEEAALCGQLSAAEDVLRSVLSPSRHRALVSLAGRRLKTELQAALKEARGSSFGQASLTLVFQGWFSLARARYQMGAGSVSQLQYDQNMVASVRLRASSASEPGASPTLVAAAQTP